MSKIEELIAEFCPEGVEFTKLEDLFKISRGRVISKDALNLNKGNYPVYSSQTARDGMIGSIDTYDYDGEYLTWTTDGANAGTIFYRNGKFSITNVCGLLKVKNYDILNPKFAYYALAVCMKSFVNYGMGNPKLMSNVAQKISIPIPPIPIQEEIVHILDKFTALEAELEAELEARKRQYEYYRNQLLAFDGKDVEWRKIEDVGEIRRGVAFTKKQAIEGKYPVVANASSPISYHNESNRTGECVVIARSGANAGLVTYWNEELFLTDAFSIHPDKVHLNTKFLYYFLKNLQRELHLMKKGSGVPHVRASDFEIYSVPVPSLKEQNRIVKILNQFDALVNDISVGLPAEIKARKEQYEYYRGKLLAFQPLVHS